MKQSFFNSPVTLLQPLYAFKCLFWQFKQPRAVLIKIQLYVIRFANYAIMHETYLQTVQKPYSISLLEYAIK